MNEKREPTIEELKATAKWLAEENARLEEEIRKLDAEWNELVSNGESRK